MTLWFVVGTAAELIKVYPLIEEAQKRNIAWFVLQTGQSAENFWMQVSDFELPTTRIIRLTSFQENFKTSFHALKWFFYSLAFGFFAIQKKIKVEKDDLFFVHGDTLSTLIGSIYGKLLKIKVVHIEAGLRSHNLRSPFPEEILRRIVSRMVHFHMCPDENAKKNLFNEGIVSGVHLTGGNTVVDALEVITRAKRSETFSHVLVNIHRFENLHSELKWNKIIEIVLSLAQVHKVIFVMMPNTSEHLKNDFKNLERLKKSGVEFKDRLPFKEFVSLLLNASFVLTDGGTNQEECYYLGKPCLILRNTTERFEGLGESCVLSRFDQKIINDFLISPEKYLRPYAFPIKRPTDVIFECLFQ